MNGMIFAGCSFTWGQGLYYYSNLKRIPTMEEWNFDYYLVNNAHINYKNGVRYARLVANHFKTFEVCRDTNGGSDELSIKFIRQILGMESDNAPKLHYLSKEKFYYDDIDYVIFQTTQPYRSAFIFNYENVDYYLWPNSGNGYFARIAKLNSNNIYEDITDDPIGLFSKWLDQTNSTLEDWLKNHIEFVFNNIKTLMIELEEKGIKTKVWNWQNDYVDMMKKDDFFKSRFITLNYKNSKYDCFDDLIQKVPNAMISKDYASFNNKPPLDHHPSMMCQKIIADSIIQSIENNYLK
jgi:hypothetical protein